MKIRAAVLEEFGKPLVVQDVDLAAPKRGEVLVRVAASSVTPIDCRRREGYGAALFARRGASPPLVLWGQDRLPVLAAALRGFE